MRSQTAGVCEVTRWRVFLAVRRQLGAVAAPGSAALTDYGFTLVVLASLLHGGEFKVCVRFVQI